MRNLILLAAAAVVLAAAPLAGAVPADDMKPPAKWAPQKKTMAKDGRFHYLHVRKEKMDCTDCHADTNGDRLFLRSTEAPPRDLSAHVDRKECMECHQGNKKPKWYGANR